MTDKEINEKVARKLGWTQRKPQSVYPYALERNEKYILLSDIPDYANDIKAAWEVVKHLSVNYGIQLSRDTEGFAKNEWRMYISTGPIEGHSAYASTAPRAICEAFLKLP